MQKVITAAFVAATAVAALSACETANNGINTTGGKKDHAATGDISKFTVPQQNAIKSAQAYLDLSGTSRVGLIQQLTSKAGEGFKMADARFALNHIQVDWNQEAVESAKAYVDLSGTSRVGLVQQLTSKAGEGFTPKQATYAVNHIKVDWNKEAVESAKSYLEMSGMSRAGLIQQLTSKAGEGFTLEQATYAADRVGL
jgi:hypothetical protein